MQKLIEDRNLFLSALKTSVEKDFSTFYSETPIIKKIAEIIETDENKHFVSLSQDDFKKISYARTSNDIFNSSKRVKTSFEKYCRRQLSVHCSSLTDSTLNYLGRQIRIKITPLDILDSKVKLLYGHEISDFYKNTTISSCMCNHNSFKTAMYALNPGVVQLIVFDESSRALLWTASCGTKIVDRIYPENCETSSMLRAWIEKKQYIYRVEKGACDDKLIQLSDGKTYSFDLLHDNVFPYLDTFCYGSIDYKKVTLTNKHFVKCFTFHSTDGEYLGEETCSACHEDIDDGDELCYEGETYCRCCYEDRFCSCYSCDETYPIDDMFQGFRSRMYCEDCFKDKFFHCEECGDLHLVDDGEPVNDCYYCQDCIKEKCFECYECEEFFLNSEENTIDNQSYCEKCFEEKFVLCSKCNEFKLISNSKIENNIAICDNCIDLGTTNGNIVI